MQDVEVLQVGRRPVPGDDAVGREPHLLAGGVLDRLGDGEHVVRIDRDRLAEDQAGAVVPDERHRRGLGQRLAALDGPDRRRPGDAACVDAGAGRPAVERVVGVLGPRGLQQRDDRRVRVDRLLEVAELEIVDAGAGQRQRALEPGGADRNPLAGGERRLDRPGARSGERRRRAGGGAGRGRRDGAVLRGLGRRLVRRLLLRREQEEPEQEHEKAERGREDQVLALVVHSGPFPSRRAWLGPGSTAGGPKGQGVIRSRRSRGGWGRAAGRAAPGSGRGTGSAAGPGTSPPTRRASA